MNERRISNRYRPNVELEVFNPLRRQKIGSIANLSGTGLRLHSNFRLNIQEEALYWVRLPSGIGQRRWIALSGKVVWRRPDREYGGYSHGIHASTSCHDQLQRLLEQADQSTPLESSAAA